MRGLSKMRSKASLPSCLMCSLLEDIGEARLKGIWLGWNVCRAETVRKMDTEVEKDVKPVPLPASQPPVEWWLSQFTCWVLQKYVSPECGCSPRDHTPKTTEDKQNAASQLTTGWSRGKPTWSVSRSLSTSCGREFLHEELITITMHHIVEGITWLLSSEAFVEGWCYDVLSNILTRYPAPTFAWLALDGGITWAHTVTFTAWWEERTTKRQATPEVGKTKERKIVCTIQFISCVLWTVLLCVFLLRGNIREREMGK